MGVVGENFYGEVLTRIGAPTSSENIRACFAWQAAEGGSAQFNPFNTTQPENGDSFYNSFGPNGEYHVRRYPTQQVGVEATVKTLLNGKYEHIVAAFRRGTDGAAVCTAIDSSPWGTSGAHSAYLRMYGRANPPTAPSRVIVLRRPYMRGSDVRVVQEALIEHGFPVGPTGTDGVYGQHTYDAVRRFQKSRHLSDDGEVGSATRHALGLPS